MCHSLALISVCICAPTLACASLCLLQMNVLFVYSQVTEQAVVLQKEVSQVVHDLVLTQKVYNTEEHIAHEARGKANEANAK